MTPPCAIVRSTSSEASPQLSSLLATTTFTSEAVLSLSVLLQLTCSSTRRSLHRQLQERSGSKQLCCRSGTSLRKEQYSSPLLLVCFCRRRPRLALLATVFVFFSRLTSDCPENLHREEAISVTFSLGKPSGRR